MAPSTTVRRLLRETLELSASSSKPNPCFHAHPVSDEDLFEWHFTLLGPPSPSPYAGGLYHGRISLPRTYPLKPPNFRFLTPSGRFEVNREICLSISGFHEESWMPAWGIRTALVALRTFMGEAGTAGQVGGMEASKEVRQRMASNSTQWRCEGCDGRTNDEIMREWWKICGEKGIKVEEEAGLEELPDGLKLGFKDQIGQNEAKGGAEETTDSEVAGRGNTMVERDTSATKVPEEPVVIESLSSTSRPGRTEKLSSPSPGTPKEASASAPVSVSSSSAPSPSRDHKTSSAQPADLPFPRVRSIPAHSMTATAAPQTRPGATPILDKAISGLVLALLFMVLKKLPNGRILLPRLQRLNDTSFKSWQAPDLTESTGNANDVVVMADLAKYAPYTHQLHPLAHSKHDQPGLWHQLFNKGNLAASKSRYRGNQFL